jgi:hypothetical protein
MVSQGGSKIQTDMDSVLKLGDGKELAVMGQVGTDKRCKGYARDRTDCYQDLRVCDQSGFF